MQTRVLLIQVGTVIAVVVLWEILVIEGFVDPLFLPSPSSIISSFNKIQNIALNSLFETLLKTLIAFLIGVGLGIPIGIVIGGNELLHKIFHPYVFGLYSIPRIVFLPLIVLFLGIGFNSNIFYAVLHTILPVILVVEGGVRNIDRRLIVYALSLGARRIQLYSKVIIPAAMPSILVALKLGIIFSLLGTLIAEMYLSLSGIGFLMQKLSYAFKSAEVFALTGVVASLAMIIVLVLSAISKKVEEKWL
jgi:ABC-type nitrate/sulfonate/bicarbonate transport system permease component